MNGALENSFNRTSSLKFTLQSKGIREHVYEILEGGKEAFEKEKESIILKCFLHSSTNQCYNLDNKSFVHYMHQSLTTRNSEGFLGVG